MHVSQEIRNMAATKPAKGRSIVSDSVSWASKDDFKPGNAAQYFDITYPDETPYYNGNGAPISSGVIKRIERVAAEYLKGRPPFILTAGLKGPFDEGWKNPWLYRDGRIPKPYIEYNTPQLPANPETHFAALSPRVTTIKLDDSRHYLSPESLQQAPSHQYLDPEELGRVQEWRDDVASSGVDKEEFWTPAADLDVTMSARKRRARGVEWLKTRAQERLRLVGESEDDEELEDSADEPETNLQSRMGEGPRNSILPSSDSAWPPPQSELVEAIELPVAEPSAANEPPPTIPTEIRPTLVTTSLSRHPDEDRRSAAATQFSKSSPHNYTFTQSQPNKTGLGSFKPSQQRIQTASQPGSRRPSTQTSANIKRGGRIVARVIKRKPPTAQPKPRAKSVSEDELSRPLLEFHAPSLRATVSFQAASARMSQPSRSALKPRRSRELYPAATYTPDEIGNKVSQKILECSTFKGTTELNESRVLNTPPSIKEEGGEDEERPVAVERDPERNRAAVEAADASSEDPFALDASSVDSTLPEEVDAVMMMNSQALVEARSSQEQDCLVNSQLVLESVRAYHRHQDTPVNAELRQKQTSSPASNLFMPTASEQTRQASYLAANEQGPAAPALNIIEPVGGLPRKRKSMVHEDEIRDPFGAVNVKGTETQMSQVVPPGDQSPWATESVIEDLVDPKKIKIKTKKRSAAQAFQPSANVRVGAQLQESQSSVVPAHAQTPWRSEDKPSQLALVCSILEHTPTSLAAASVKDERDETPSLSRHAPRQPGTPDPPQRNSAGNFSLKSFSTFMSPPKKRCCTHNSSLNGFSRNRLSTPQSILVGSVKKSAQMGKSAAGSARASTPRKRVSWAPLPGEDHGEGSVVDSHHSSAWSRSRQAASPPPAMALPEHIEELEDEDNKFEKHFQNVRMRTRSSTRKDRLLPTASQQTQRSPQVDAMAEAFVVADHVLGSAESGRDEPVQDEEGGDDEPAERDGAEDKETEPAEAEEELGGRVEDALEDAPLDDVDDVMANLDEFLNPWDVEREEGGPPSPVSPLRRTSRVLRPSFRILQDMEVGGW